MSQDTVTESPCPPSKVVVKSAGGKLECLEYGSLVYRSSPIFTSATIEPYTGWKPREAPSIPPTCIVGAQITVAGQLYVCQRSDVWAETPYVVQPDKPCITITMPAHDTYGAGFVSGMLAASGVVIAALLAAVIITRWWDRPKKPAETIRFSYDLPDLDPPA